MSRSQELDVIRGGGIQYKQAEILEASVQFDRHDCHPLEQDSLVAVVGGNEVTNPFVVTEVYVQESGTRRLASLSFTRLLTATRAKLQRRMFDEHESIRAGFTVGNTLCRLRRRAKGKRRR